MARSCGSTIRAASGSLDYIARGQESAHKLLAGLGPEPLEPGFDGGYLNRALAGKMTPIKSALLDQRIVAGLGNIYVCEALYRARISPRRLAASVVGARAQRLAIAIREVLAEAIEAGGSSLRDYVQANGELGYFQHRWAVYGKEGRAVPGLQLRRGRPSHHASRPIDLLLRHTAAIARPASENPRLRCAGPRNSCVNNRQTRMRLAPNAMAREKPKLSSNGAITKV